MMLCFSHNTFIHRNKEGLLNFIILSLVLAPTIIILSLSPCTESLRYFTLPILMGFITAVWIGWHAHTRRVIGLVLCGALVGLATEYTASFAKLWTYKGYLNHNYAYVGAFIHSLMAVVIFGLAYFLDRMISFCRFSRITGWPNAFLLLTLFLTLFAFTEGAYVNNMAENNWAPLYYYSILFALAVTLAFCLRVGRLISIILAAMLVGLIGEYAGGTKAHIWWWLGESTAAESFPPLFLILALWPMEGIIEYSLSALYADWIVSRTKVKRRLKIERGEAPEPGTNGPLIDLKTALEPDDILFWGHALPGEGRLEHMLRIGKRSLLKTLRNTPEKGELLVLFFGLLTGLLIVFEQKLPGASQPDLLSMSWATAAVLSAAFLLALMVAPKPYWNRTLWFGLFSLVFGYGMQAALQLAFNDFEKDSPCFGNPFWGPLWVTVFFVVYGAAYLVTRAVASLSGSEKDRKDKEEPSVQVAVTVTVLALIFLALFVIRPDFLMPLESSTKQILIRNPFLLYILLSVLAVFCFWWFFFRIRLLRSLCQFFSAIAIIAGLLLLIQEWCQISAWKHLPEGIPPWLVGAAALSLAYLFSYTASAHVSGEPLAKAFRVTYSRRPLVKNKKPLKVVFHPRPHPEGRRRMMIDTTLYTYPPKESGVNVTYAKDPKNHGQELSLEQSIEKALQGLVGCWHNPETREVTDSLKDAVKKRKVFIKPNVVVPFGSPYTTDPMLVAAVVKFCLSAGASSVSIGEIAISNITSRLALESTGLRDLWESINPKKEKKKVEVLFLDELPFRKVDLEGTGVLMRDFHMPEALLEPDTFYINIPKMKTHVQSSVTLGIKNSHGLVPEIDRGLYHQRISQKVVDITKVWVPDLTIVDGYDALEGIGPWPGDLVPLRVLVLSDDVVLADLVSSQLMGKESIPADFTQPIDFARKTVKSTWLAYVQRLGLLHPDATTRTIGDDRHPIQPRAWDDSIRKHKKHFAPPAYEDEGLIRNIGARFGKVPDLTMQVKEPFPHKCAWEDWDPATEFLLPLDAHDPTSNWGPIQLISDEWRFPDLGSSVMFSGVFGLMKTIMESHFQRSLDIFEGYVIVYGPLRKPLVCEGAILFGDRAIETEQLVFAPRVYQLPGHGRPPNYYSDVFERLSHDVGGDLMAFCTEAITLSRGWYW